MSHTIKDIAKPPIDIKGMFKNNFEKQFLKIIFDFYKTKVYFLILSSLFFFPPNSISNGSAVLAAAPTPLAVGKELGSLQVLTSKLL